MNQPGVRIKFQGNTLPVTFAHQFAPFRHFGCTFDKPFNGTLFRFPLRSGTNSGTFKSEISKRNYTVADVQSNIKQLIEQLPNLLLFLRSVRRIEVYTCPHGSKEPIKLHQAEARFYDQVNMTVDVSLFKYFDHQKYNTTTATASDYSSSGYSSSSSVLLGKDEFYDKLLKTPDNKLPKRQSKVHIHILSYDNIPPSITPIAPIPQSETAIDIEGKSTSTSTSTLQNAHKRLDSASINGRVVCGRTDLVYLVVSGIGGGEAKRMSCKENMR